MKNKTASLQETFPRPLNRVTNDQASQSITPLKKAAAKERSSRAALSQIRPIPRRGLSREEAAMFLGISASKFDEMVGDGRMPGPRRIDARKVWDVRELDLAFDNLPHENEQRQNTWDDA
jgi:predicted DNA-binding transcriptional regulator AlpA